MEPNDLRWSLTEFMLNMSPTTTYNGVLLSEVFNMSQDRTNHLQEENHTENILVHQIKPGQDLRTKCGIARKKTPPESSTFPIFIPGYSNGRKYLSVWDFSVHWTEFLSMDGIYKNGRNLQKIDGISETVLENSEKAQGRKSAGKGRNSARNGGNYPELQSQQKDVS